MQHHYYDNLEENWFNRGKLYQAIENHDLNEVKKLIEAGVNIQADDDAELSPLSTAIRQNDLEIVKALLENSADPDGVPWGEKTPIIHAIEVKSVEIIRELIKHGADLDDAIETAIHKNELGILIELLKPGTDNTYFVKEDSLVTLPSMHIAYLLLASFSLQKRQNVFETFAQDPKLWTDPTPELEAFLSNPEESSVFLDIVKFLLDTNLVRDPKILGSKLTAPELTNTLYKVLPPAFFEHKDFDTAFKQAYQSALTISAIDRYARQNGFLNLQAPSESSSSLTKEAAIQLPDTLSAYITTFHLQLPLPTASMLFEVAQERLSTPSENQKTLPSPKVAFCQKLTLSLEKKIHQVKETKIAEAQKSEFELKAKTEEKQAREGKINQKAGTFINRTIEEAKKREQEQEECEGKDTLEAFKTKPIEKKDPTSRALKEEDRSR